MKKFVFVLLSMLSVVLSCAVVAKASPWSQPFLETGVGNFDQISMFMKTDTEFFMGSSGYSASGWSTAVNEPDYILAEGPDVSYLNLSVGFTGRETFMFDFFALRDGIIREGATVAWINNDWVINSIMPLSRATEIYQADLAAVTADPVPEPATMILFGAGIAGLSFVGRKKILM